MKILSSLLLSLLILSNFTYGQNSVENAVSSFVNGSGMEHASVSIMVYDLDKGTTVAKHDELITMPTASTTKLFSTATAIDILGPDYRAKTRIYMDGYVKDSILGGNIWIRGGGDPSLGSKYFNREGHELDFMQPWVDSLKAMGIKKINGAVIGDASEFGYEGVPDGWDWVDMGNYYGAGASGLTIYDNLVRYNFSSGGRAGEYVKVESIEPEVPGLIYHNYVKASTKPGDNAYLYGGPYSYERFGTGTIPLNQSNFLVKGSLPDPEFQIAYEFNKALYEAGIEVDELPRGVRSMDRFSTQSEYDKRTLIATHLGEKLNDIIKETNFRSVNLYAEHMVNLVGYEKTGDGSTASGLSVLEAHWKNKMYVDGIHVNDGSGLSRSNAIAARHYIELLKAMKSSTHYASFYASLPVAGESGTMRNICKGQTAHGRIHAKSGSITRVKSYAGYVNTTTGKNLAFAIIVNNFDGSSSTLSSRMQSLMNSIAAY